MSEEQESAQLGNQRGIAAKQEAERLAHVCLNRAHVESFTDEHEKVTGVAGNRHLDFLLKSELVEIDGQRAVGLAQLLGRVVGVIEIHQTHEDF